MRKNLYLIIFPRNNSRTKAMPIINFNVNYVKNVNTQFKLSITNWRRKKDTNHEISLKLLRQWLPNFKGNMIPTWPWVRGLIISAIKINYFTVLCSRTNLENHYIY